MIEAYEESFEEGKKLFATGHAKESIDYFTKAKDEGCNPVNVYLSRGAAYLNVGNLDEAVADFSRVLDIDNDNERALYYRGIVQLSRSNYEEAIEDLNRAIKLNKERGAAFLARGLAYGELGKDDEARRDLKTAVSFSDIEVENFVHQFGSHRTMFEKTMMLLEGERGPWKIVFDEAEANKLKKWLQ